MKVPGRSSLSLVVLLALAGAAYATIDMTGRWVVFGDPSGLTVFDFVQTGTALSQSPTLPPQPGPRTGFIDSATGAFSVWDPLPCMPPILPRCGIGGTVSPDGLTFTGTGGCETGLACFVGITQPVLGWRSPATCGNGIVDPGEQCDDGSNLPGECCDPGCRFVTSGTLCGLSNCNGTQACDGAGTCVTGPGTACDPCSRCDAGSGFCLADPAPTCGAPTVSGAAQLTLRTSVPSQFEVIQSSLKWRWGRGQATMLDAFGDPVHTDGYALCLYDADGTSTLLRAVLPPGTGWQARPNGFRYRDKLGVADGLTAVDLQAGAAGKAKVKVRAARGPNLQVPGLPLFPPVTMQLRGHGQCWGASYAPAGVKRNTATAFVAKGQ